MGEHVEEIDNYFFKCWHCSYKNIMRDQLEQHIERKHFLRMIMTPNAIAPNLFQDLNISIAVFCILVEWNGVLLLN